jgi:hypothetical protein
MSRYVEALLKRILTAEARVAELEQREKIAVEAAQEFHDEICRLQEARDNLEKS